MPGRQQLFRLTVLVLLAQFVAMPCVAQPRGFESDTRAFNLAHGRVVFTDKCMHCHESGRKGAPVFGDSEDWGERLEQPLNTLIEHAVAGHGRMPPGGDLELTEQDVAAAVAYVVYHSRLLLLDVNALPATASGRLADASCGPEQDGQGCLPAPVANSSVLNMLLLLVGQERWK